MGQFDQVLAGAFGHVLIDSTDGVVTDYHIKGFIVTEDATFTTLIEMGNGENVKQTKTYFAGVYYPARMGYYTTITVASGSIVGYKTKSSPN